MTDLEIELEVGYQQSQRTRILVVWFNQPGCSCEFGVAQRGDLAAFPLERFPERLEELDLRSCKTFSADLQPVRLRRTNLLRDSGAARSLADD